MARWNSMGERIATASVRTGLAMTEGKRYRARKGRNDTQKGIVRIEKMNRKRELFIQEYLVDLCGAAAARRAGYSAKGAKNQAYRLLHDPKIKAAVDAAMEERLERIQVRQEEVLRELKAVAMAQASDGNGAQVKLGSKLRALELLGKHLGLFEGKPKQTGEPVQILEDV